MEVCSQGGFQLEGILPHDMRRLFHAYHPRLLIFLLCLLLNISAQGYQLGETGIKNRNRH